MDSLGIYISVPFCRSKCSYCNFASGVFPSGLQREYVERLCADIRSIGGIAHKHGAVLPEKIGSIYLGGGTPSILQPALLQSLFRAIREEFAVAEAAEITMECAPGQLSDPAMAAMLEAGVNRVSFGVQSFVDREAAVTGRLHTRATAMQDVDRVRAAGIRNINVDLIAGLPHQTEASWRESLAVLLDTGVPHASIYMLEVDEDSRLGRELLAGGGRYHASTVPGEALTADLYDTAVGQLQQQGLEQYEISNFAAPGAESHHNLRYWRRQPYLGFGLDAHSMLRTSAGALRFRTSDDLPAFLNSGALLEMHSLKPSEQLEEAWFLGLRLVEGVRWSALAREFGAGLLAPFGSVVDDLCSDGLLQQHSESIRLTPRGRLLANEVFVNFLGVADGCERPVLAGTARV